LTGILELTDGPYDKAIVAGTGIDTSSFRTMTDAMWKPVLPRFSQSRPDGQYAVLCWNNSELALYTDPMGLRKWFVAELDDVILFSTRLDLLTAALPNPEIDFSALESWWHLIFNLSPQKCFIRDVMRSGMRCTITISPSGANEAHRPWIPEPVTTNLETVIGLLEKYMSAYRQIHPITHFSAYRAAWIAERCLLSCSVRNVKLRSTLPERNTFLIA
jgi:hypothetical protein